MAATNLGNQLHSAQKNLLFLQQEHTLTFKGLHPRSGACSNAAQIRADTQELRTDRKWIFQKQRNKEKVQRTGSSTESPEERKQQTVKELEQKNVMIMMLENAIKEQEKKYLEKLKAKSCKVKMLFSELE